METVKQKHTSPERVLDGHDMNQDIGQLIGYVHSIGIHTGEKGIFPSEHLCALNDAFLRKHRPIEYKSPKAMQNNAHQMKALVHHFRSTQKRCIEVSEKLAVHEHYMKVMKTMERSLDYGTVSEGKADYLADCVEGFANNLERESKEFMTKPESFDDIPDDWYEDNTKERN